MSVSSTISRFYWLIVFGAACFSSIDNGSSPVFFGSILPVCQAFSIMPLLPKSPPCTVCYMKSSSTFTSLAKYLFKEVTEDINELTGKSKWEPGDLLSWMSKNEYKYKFGDLTKWATGFAKDQALELTGADNLTELGTNFIAKVKSGEYETDDIYLALKVLLTTTSNMGLLPMKGLPIRYLLKLVDLGISKDEDDEMMSELSNTLETRIHTALESDDAANKEEVTTLVKEFTGKDKYSFGDIAKVIMEQAKEKNAKPRTLELNKIVDDIEEWDDKVLETAAPSQ